MYSQTIRIAEITVSVQSISDFSRQFAKYIDSAEHNADISVCISADRIADCKTDYCGMDAKSIEFCLIYKDICDELPRFDAYMLHSAVVEYEGKAYAFCAKSGTGKTTHAQLWHKKLDGELQFINGDKPIIRFVDGIPIAYGSPWNGKENRGDNISAPLNGICFLVRGDVPAIRRVDKKEGVFRLLCASHKPRCRELAEAFYNCVGKTIENVKLYELSCDVSEKSAELSFNEMTGVGT